MKPARCEQGREVQYQETDLKNLPFQNSRHVACQRLQGDKGGHRDRGNIIMYCGCVCRRAQGISSGTGFRGGGNGLRRGAAGLAQAATRQEY